VLGQRAPVLGIEAPPLVVGERRRRPGKVARLTASRCQPTERS
jgi:hypothetical protein